MALNTDCQFNTKLTGHQAVKEKVAKCICDTMMLNKHCVDSVIYHDIGGVYQIKGNVTVMQCASMSSSECSRGSQKFI